MRFIEYPKTRKLRDVVETYSFAVSNDKWIGSPVVEFTGTVKIHGTNGAVIQFADKSIQFQSRSRVVSVQNDNEGFAVGLSRFDLSFLFDRFEFNDYCAIYGEWCGENIQGKVAIQGLPKMFVIFRVLVDDKWVDLPHDLHDNKKQIFNIFQFPTYKISIDLSSPESSLDEIDRLTLEVERECPVGLHFKRSGIGEGIVFTANTNPDMIFKSKGVEHAKKTKRVLSPDEMESFEPIKEFVDSVFTESRCMQAIAFMREMSIPVNPKSTRQFIDWMISDIEEEEWTAVTANNLDEKKVKRHIATESGRWFANYNR